MDIHLSSPAVDFEVDVRLTRRDDRWVAVARVRGQSQVGLGRTAREALAASVGHLDRRAAAALLAEPGLMAASLQVL